MPLFGFLVLCAICARGGILAQSDAIELLKLQHERSDCIDLKEFVEFKRTYNISKALAHASDFTVEYDKISSKYKVLYTCENVFRSKEEKESVWPPPKLPWLKENNAQYVNDLALSEPTHVTLTDYYIQADRHNDGDGFNWPQSQLDELAAAPSTCGMYFQDQCEKAFSIYSRFIKDKYGMVIGSQSPWAEALGFRYGAARMITYEYMKIVTSHPKLSTITPSEAAAKYLAGKFEPVDFIFTYSSLEHDGLGRYGDPINAFGDFESIAKMHCMLKPNGILFFGVPIGMDEVLYNAHRVYGSRRLSVVLSLGFRLVDIVNYQPFRIGDRNSRALTQPVLVMQKHDLHETHSGLEN
jgi:hypothetical protein